jgi:N-acetyl-gamma-glutamylphosphate reductase
MVDIDDEVEAPPSLDAEEIASVPMDKLAKVYRKMAAKIQQLTREYETEVEAIKAQQDVVKIALKDQMLKLGVKSVRTDQGTVVLSTTTNYNTQDWDSFKEFMKQYDALDLVQQRISQLNMKRFLEENPGVVPPGLNSMTEYGISVRKPTK